MPTYINMPTFNLNENNIPSTSISYTNSELQSISNAKQMFDRLQQNKVEKEVGKGLSSNDFTDAYKNKLDGIEQELYFSSYIEFPTIGNANTLYIDNTRNAMYLWDSVGKVYTPIIVDTQQDNYIIQSVL